MDEYERLYWDALIAEGEKRLKLATARRNFYKQIAANKRKAARRKARKK